MADTHIIPFVFEGEHLIRVTEINANPWFVAADACRVLDVKNPTDAVKALDDDEKASVSPSTLGLTEGGPDRIIVSEGGLYTLILRSRQATTPGTVQHRFRKWVTAEVLPAIRKTGSYQGAAPAPKPPLDLPWRERSLEEKRVELTTAALLAKVDSPERALHYIDNEMRIPGPPRPYKKRQQSFDLGDAAEEFQDVMTFADPRRNGEGTH